MKILKEYIDGFRWVEGNTSSVPFEKDSDLYNEKLAEGFELELMPQAEKDAHEQEQARDKANQEALSYLASTDWYVIRSLDSGEPIPDEVKAGRVQARAAIR
jgi:hypothetical protein